MSDLRYVDLLCHPVRTRPTSREYSPYARDFQSEQELFVEVGPPPALFELEETLLPNCTRGLLRPQFVLTESQFWV